MHKQDHLEVWWHHRQSVFGCLITSNRHMCVVTVESRAVFKSTLFEKDLSRSKFGPNSFRGRGLDPERVPGPNFSNM